MTSRHPYRCLICGRFEWPPQADGTRVNFAKENLCDDCFRHRPDVPSVPWRHVNPWNRDWDEPATRDHACPQCGAQKGVNCFIAYDDTMECVEGWQTHLARASLVRELPVPGVIGREPNTVSGGGFETDRQGH